MASGIKVALAYSNFWSVAAILEKTILKEASEVALREVAARQEMVTMQQDGILKVLEGKTTLEEVVGATGELAW